MSIFPSNKENILSRILYNFLINFSLIYFLNTIRIEAFLNGIVYLFHSQGQIKIIGLMLTNLSHKCKLIINNQ